MKRIYMLAAILAANPCSALAQGLPDPLVSAAKEYQHALVTRDKATLERLTAADFLLIEPNGLANAREEALGEMLDPEHRIEPFTVDVPLTRSWDTGAVLGGLFHVRGTDHGKSIDVRRHVTSVWGLDHGAWKIFFLKVEQPTERDKEIMNEK